MKLFEGTVRFSLQVRKELRYVGMGIIVVLVSQLLNGLLGTMKNQGHTVVARLANRSKRPQVPARNKPLLKLMHLARVSSHSSSQRPRLSRQDSCVNLC